MIENQFKIEFIIFIESQQIQLKQQQRRKVQNIINSGSIRNNCDNLPWLFNQVFEILQNILFKILQLKAHVKLSLVFPCVLSTSRTGEI